MVAETERLAGRQDVDEHRLRGEESRREKADYILMNPVRMSQVRDIAFAGEVLPQKSTDFYPKLLTGVTIDVTGGN